MDKEMIKVSGLYLSQALSYGFSNSYKVMDFQTRIFRCVWKTPFRKSGHILRSYTDQCHG